MVVYILVFTSMLDDETLKATPVSASLPGPHHSAPLLHAWSSSDAQ